MRKLFAPSLVSIAFLTSATTAFAQNVNVNACPGGNFSPICLGAGSIGTLLANGINLLFVAAAILALGFLIFGGIKWLTSQGEKEGISKARETIVAAIVGLVIIFLSYIIVNFLLNLFVGVNLFNLTLPTLVSH